MENAIGVGVKRWYLFCEICGKISDMEPTGVMCGHCKADVTAKKGYLWDIGGTKIMEWDHPEIHTVGRMSVLIPASHHEQALLIYRLNNSVYLVGGDDRQTYFQKGAPIYNISERIEMTLSMERG